MILTSSLDGIKVLDLTRTLAGPFCTMMLGDMGAEVIKVEEPLRGDETRYWPPLWNGVSAHFLPFNRNKKSITLNLKNPKALEICLSLASQSDVLVENFKTDTVERLGLDYKTIQLRNPEIVYCSISGYGRTGPLANDPGYDLISQGYGGLMSVTGNPEGSPVRTGYSIGDLFTGMAAYGAITSALFSRERSGKGQYLETSLLESMVALMSYHATTYFATGTQPRRLGSAHPGVAPYQVFETKDGYLVIGVANDTQWHKLCQAMGLDHLSKDNRFDTNSNRVAHRKDLIEILNKYFAKKPTRIWITIIKEFGVPCAPINSIADVVNDPQVLARNMIIEMQHPQIPELKMPNNPMTLHGTPTEIRYPPPQLGEHNTEVLTSLGYTKTDITQLHNEQAI